MPRNGEIGKNLVLPSVDLPLLENIGRLLENLHLSERAASKRVGTLKMTMIASSHAGMLIAEIERL